MKHDPNRPKVPEVIDRFYAYYLMHEGWGMTLHVCLEDSNFHLPPDPAEPLARGDAEGAALATLLGRMSPTQRGKIAKLCSLRRHMESL